MKNTNIKKALVLGGEGQIGKPLCSFLAKNDIEVCSVDLALGKDHDLRKECQLMNDRMAISDVVFFLAYDIGGSKFLKTRQDDYDFLQNNTKIMSKVFESLHRHNKPFLFASSVMANMPWSPYGNLKRLGEHFTKSLGGISARFWNIYGPESDEEKFHVITDFIKKAKTTGTIEMLTDGSEVRQFLHADDCSKAMLSLLQNYEIASQHEVFDITSFVWTDIRSVAQVIAKHYKAEILVPTTKDTVQKDSRIEPNKYPISKFWDPNSAISIEVGIHKMIEYYENTHEK